MDKKIDIRLVNVRKVEIEPVIDIVFGFFLNDDFTKDSRKKTIQNLVDKYELTAKEFVEVFIYYAVYEEDTVDAERNLEKFILKTTQKLGVKFSKKEY